MNKDEQIILEVLDKYGKLSGRVDYPLFSDRKVVEEILKNLTSN